jgi:hypothetical protein
MANFDNIKCIDLTVYNYEKLEEIGTALKIANPSLLAQNKRIGIGKIWFDTKNNNAVIAYTIKGNNEVLIADNFIADITKIKPVDIIVKEKEQNVTNLVESVINSPRKIKTEVILDVDTILDKIGQYGINSITKEEKDFLDNN